MDDYVSQSKENEKLVQKIIELKTILKEKKIRSKISSSEESSDSDYVKAQIQELKIENQKMRNLYESEVTKRIKLESQLNLKVDENNKMRISENNKEFSSKIQKIYEENLKLKNVKFFKNLWRLCN